MATARIRNENSTFKIGLKTIWLVGSWDLRAEKRVEDLAMVEIETSNELKNPCL